MNGRNTIVALLATIGVASMTHDAHARGAICGDVNGDGVVSVTDAVQVQRFAAGLDPEKVAGACNSLGANQCGDVDQSGSITVTDAVLVQNAAAGLSSPCSVQGWGDQSNSGSVLNPGGRPYVPVTSTADAGAGSLRAALASIGAGGGLVVFDLAAGSRTITLTTGALTVPANTVIDGIGAAHVTIKGQNAGSNGVLNVWNSNVAIRHLRIRNASGDGIQIAPKRNQASIHDIAIQHVTVEKALDGAIDVTGCVGLSVTGCSNGTLSNVTLAQNFLAGSHDASLIKYGATNVTLVGNLLRVNNLARHPSVDTTSSPSLTAVGDVRYNLVQNPTEGWVKAAGSLARVNVVSNWFELSPTAPIPQQNTIVNLQGGAAYVPAGSNTIPTGAVLINGTSAGSAYGSPPAVTSTTRDVVLNTAGALPRDSVDACYVSALTWSAAQSSCQ
jgi:hypothetical protein